MIRQDKYVEHYGFWRDCMRKAPVEELERSIQELLDEKHFPSTPLLLRACKDELASRIPEREFIHDRLGYDS